MGNAMGNAMPIGHAAIPSPIEIENGGDTRETRGSDRGSALDSVIDKQPTYYST